MIVLCGAFVLTKDQKSLCLCCLSVARVLVLVCVCVSVSVSECVQLCFCVCQGLRGTDVACGIEGPCACGCVSVNSCFGSFLLDLLGDVTK